MEYTRFIFRDLRVEDVESNYFSMDIKSESVMLASKKSGVVQNPPKPFGVLDMKVGDEVKTAPNGPSFQIKDINPEEEGQ